MSETMGQPTPPTAGENAAGDTIRKLLEPFQLEAAATRIAIEDRSRTQRRINMWLVAFVGVTTILTIMVLYVLIQDGQRRAQSRQILRNNETLSRQIADCSTPGGSCYEQGQARLRFAIQQLNQQNLYIAECARTTATQVDLLACVQAKTVAPAPSKTPAG